MSTEEDAAQQRQIQTWRVKNLIKSLERARGNGTSMISLIIPPRDQISRVQQMLTTEYGTASNIKSRVNRQSVLDAITSTQQRLKLYARIPDNGLVIYCGTIMTDDNKEKKVVRDFEPFKPINTSLYLCDNKFHTEPLNELLVDDDKFGFVVMDGTGTLFGTVSGSSREVLHKIAVDLPKKHGRGGQSAVRFARLRTEKRHNYLRKVAELCVSFFITNDKCNCTGLVLSGLADFKNELNGSDMFDPRLKRKVVAIVDTAYGGENGFNQAIELAGDALKDVKFVQEKKVLNKFMDHLAKDTSRYSIGLSETLRAMEMGAAETVILWENLPTVRVTLKNPSTGAESVVHVSSQEELEKAGGNEFKEKGTGESLEVVESMPFLEFLADNYRKFGCSLEFVSDRSPEGTQFVKGFGGMGAILRYAVEAGLLQEEEEAAGQEKGEEDEDYWAL